MLTRSLITFIKKEHPEWSRENIRELLNEVHNIIFTTVPTRQMRMFNSTTGKDPSFTATSSTYEYTIDSNNGFDNDAWRVVSVYEDDVDDPTDCVKYDGTPSANAKIIFTDSQSGTFYVRAYKKPTEITTESVQLAVPTAYHLSHVKPGVVGLMEISKSGKSEQWEKWERKLLPELLNRLSEGPNHYFNVTYRGY